MSNKILSDTNHTLSAKFPKDVPIAEKNSIDIGLEILFRPEYKDFRTAIIPNDVNKIQFAKTLFQCILVTDIATPENVKLGIRRYEVSLEDGECEAALCPLAHYIAGLFDGVGLDDDVKVRHPNEFIVTHNGLHDCVRNEHLMLLSDTAHLVQGWENFIKWNFRLCELDTSPLHTFFLSAYSLAHTHFLLLPTFTDKELYECYKKGLCGDPREGWFQGQVGFLDKYIIPLAKRSSIYFHQDFSESLVNNGLTNLAMWMAHGKQATDIMTNATDDNEKESGVLQRLYELPTL